MPGADPCTGEPCEEALERCVECSTSADCDDGVFCNGLEKCFDVACQPGSPPCTSGTCDEQSATCTCSTSTDCNDGNSCTDDTCMGGICVIIPVECDDGVFCNGAERCGTGGCVPGTPPCEAPRCDESADACTCTTPADCDDGVFCNGVEICDAGFCRAGPYPCPTPLCDESLGACFECLGDGPCVGGPICTEDIVCIDGVCVGGTRSPADCENIEECDNPGLPNSGETEILDELESTIYLCLPPTGSSALNDRDVPVTHRIVTHDTPRARDLEGWLKVSHAAGDASVVDLRHLGNPYVLDAPIPVIETGHAACDEHTWHFGDEVFTLIPRSVGEVTLAAEVDPAPECCEGDGVSAVEAQVTVKVISVDLDIDSDNNNGDGPPDRNAPEEQCETAGAGRLIRVNDDDDDDNGVADKDQEPPPTTDDDLVPMVVELQGSISGGSWRLVYDASKLQIYEDDRNTIAQPDTERSLPLSPNPQTFWVEGLDFTAGGPAMVTAAVDLDDDGTIECTDSVVVSVVDFKLKALDFASAHDPMRDNSTDYEPTGPVFEEPEWFPGWTPPRNAPFSHTMDSNVVIEAIIFVQPSDLPDTPFRITCTGPQGFNFDQTVTLHGALNLSTVTSTDLLERRIQKLTADLTWRIELGGFSYVHEQTGPHTAYITMGAPRDTDQDPHVVTQNRMDRAVDWASRANSTKPHSIVQKVMQDVAPHFNLNRSSENAWDVPEDLLSAPPGQDPGVDCQSMVRFAENVAKMVNFPGTFEHVNIYAVETDPMTAIEDDPNCVPVDTCPCCGFNSNLRVHPANPAWVLSLVVGGGCNSFEATAKFTYCSETRYYPGGTTAVYEDKDDVLYVFDMMSWVVEGDLPACTLAPEAPVFEYVPKPPYAAVPDCP